LLFIASHDTFVRTLGPTASDVYGTLVATMPVMPNLGVQDSIYMTPSALCFASLPFSYWRGTIIFTVRCVCSAFHSGSLRVVYDPSTNVGAPGATNPFEMARTCILEMKPGATMELEIGWSQPTMWLPIDTIIRTTADAETNCVGFCNGVLRFYVQNQLTTPLASQIPDFVVTQRAGSDFRWSVPRDIPAYTTNQAPPAFFDEDAVTFQAAIINNIAAVGQCSFGSVGDPVRLTRITMGDEIVSLRAYLKRYQHLGFLVGSVAGTAGINNKTFTAAFPMAESGVGGPQNMGSAVNPLFVDYQTPFRWFRCAYYGMRGGLKVRIRALQETNAGVLAGKAMIKVVVNNNVDSVAVASNSSAGTLSQSSAAECVYEGQADRADFLVPDYNIYRYTFAGVAFKPGVSSGYGRWSVTVTRPVNDATAWTYGFSRAIADDFSFFGWMGVPIFKLS